MTQGHRDSLGLRCRAFTSPSPCRFIPALSLTSQRSLQRRVMTNAASRRPVIGVPLRSPHVAAFGWKQSSHTRRQAAPRVPDLRRRSTGTDLPLPDRLLARLRLAPRRREVALGRRCARPIRRLWDDALEKCDRHAGGLVRRTGQSGLARVEQAPAPPSADKQGPGRVAHDAEVASDAAGCATGEQRGALGCGGLGPAFVLARVRRQGWLTRSARAPSKHWPARICTCRTGSWSSRPCMSMRLAGAPAVRGAVDSDHPPRPRSL